MPARRTARGRGRRRRGCTALCAALLGLLQARAAEEATGPAPDQAAPEVRFRALDLHDRREALADVLHRLTSERDSRREEHRAYIEAVAAFQAVQSPADDEARLKACIGVATSLERLDEQLRDSRLRRLEVLDRVQAEAGQTDGSASVEGAKILREVDAEVRLMLAQQAEQSRRMDGLKRQVTALANAIPPPAEFQEAGGPLMRLTGRGPEAFYASTTPATAGLFLRFVQAQPPGPARSAWESRLAGAAPESVLGGVSWPEAQRLCEWLSSEERVPYRLPSLKEAEALAQARPGSAAAFWCAEPWAPRDHQERRDLKRFGVDLVTLWDGTAKLTGKTGPSAEVPFARYPSLVVYLVTPIQTGVALRWQRVRAQPP